MRIKYLCFLLMSLLPLRAYAGDCRSHPMFIHEMEIRSCELISEANAGRVSKGAAPRIVATRYPGVILEGTEKAIRQIDLEEPFREIKFAVHPWQRKDRETIFLFQSKNLNGCSTFKLGTRVKFASFTNCECDTGPAPDGYCALTVPPVTTIPNEHLKYAEWKPIYQPNGADADAPLILAVTLHFLGNYTIVELGWWFPLIIYGIFNFGSTEGYRKKRW